MYVYKCVDSYISLMLQMVYTRVARGMLHNDRLVLAVLLARIHLKGVPE